MLPKIVEDDVNESEEALIQMLQTKTKLLPFNHLTKLPFQNNRKHLAGKSNFYKMC